MKKMIKIIAIMGKAGAGKDTLLNAAYLKEPYKYNKIISCTTRPPRENETQGIDYYFLTKEEFLYKIDKGEMLEFTEFRDWYYGTSLDLLSNTSVNIGVFNPEGVRTLTSLKSEVEVLPVYIAASDKERLIRQLLRENKPNVKEIMRRYQTDEEDFAEIETMFDNMILINGNRPIQDVVADFQKLVKI